MLSDIINALNRTKNMGALWKAKYKLFTIIYNCIFKCLLVLYKLGVRLTEHHEN